MSQSALEDQVAGMQIAGGEEAAPSPLTFFDFDALPDDMQLQVCKWTDPSTLNAVRRVDKKRRKLIYDHPKFFEQHQMISALVVRTPQPTDASAERKFEWELVFVGYCNKCGRYEKNSNFLFIDMKCVDGCRRCSKCDKDVEPLPAASPLMGKTLQECLILITKGARIGSIELRCKLTDNLIDALSHLIDSSYRVTLAYCDWESSDALKSIIYSKSFASLRWNANKYQIRKAATLIDDEFYLKIGSKTFMIANADVIPITNAQLSLLFGRLDLKTIYLCGMEGITVEGVRRAIQALLLGNYQMEIGFLWSHPFDELFALSAKIGLEKIEYAEEENEEANGKHAEIVKTFTYTLDERKVVLKVRNEGDLSFEFNLPKV